MKRHGISVAVVLSLALAASTHAAGLFDYNLVVTNTLDTNSEVEGRTFVNNLKLAGTSQFGIKQLAGTSDVLSVANDITSSQNVQIQPYYGSFRHTKALPSNVTVQLQQGASNVLTPVDITALASEMSTTSTAAAGLTANSSYSTSGGTLVFNLTYNPAGQAVVSLPASVLNQNQNLNLSIPQVPSGKSLIVNVTGLSVIDITSNFNATAANAQNVLWNFPGASAITFERSFYGSILAPGANISNTTALTGGVYVANFTMRGEVHHPLDATTPPTTTAEPPFKGPVVVPEPAGLAVLAIPMLAMGRRRR
jgi:choice-of-anchor A domain-containing protein